ncbi:FxSxx-COOH cyclophane-containing RiPP peptide [Actinomadura syzygii]|uniref:FXSXX-COOH protein n=1 Tax=Actinomadura syzygii TaxID=1427538 RepID=A0A5D0UJR6_9ACTN|nr:FxSxx-COOH cyclophane-containing RiPP peptide [Actinomadura syzygii]TYC17379.1 FXSXX-COOH protein [Actinomadura syzygii]
MQQESTFQGGLIDVSGLSLRQLDDEIGESVFAGLLHEILAPAPGEPATAGFNSNPGEIPAASAH